MKNCSVCKELKPLEDFSRDKKVKDGRVSRCKVCTTEYAAAYYKKHAERLKADCAKYRADNPEKVKEMDRKYKDSKGVK